MLVVFPFRLEQRPNNAHLGHAKHWHMVFKNKTVVAPLFVLYQSLICRWKILHCFVLFALMVTGNGQEWYFNTRNSRTSRRNKMRIELTCWDRYFWLLSIAVLTSTACCICRTGWLSTLKQMIKRLVVKGIYLLT